MVRAATFACDVLAHAAWGFDFMQAELAEVLTEESELLRMKLSDCEQQVCILQAHACMAKCMACMARASEVPCCCRRVAEACKSAMHTMCTP